MKDFKLIEMARVDMNKIYHATVTITEYTTNYESTVHPICKFNDSDMWFYSNTGEYLDSAESRMVERMIRVHMARLNKTLDNMTKEDFI